MSGMSFYDAEGDSITVDVIGDEGDRKIAFGGSEIVHLTPVEAAAFASAVSELADRTY